MNAPLRTKSFPVHTPAYKENTLFQVKILFTKNCQILSESNIRLLAKLQQSHLTSKVCNRQVSVL